MDWNTEDNMLTASEVFIMKTIWDEVEDISIPDLIEVLRTKWGKDYARTTVTTFLTKMTAKGFVKTYRIGKLSYAHAMKSEEEYKDKLLNDMIEFWYDGNIAALQEKVSLKQEDKK